MANQYVNKILKSTGETLIDLTEDSVTANTMLAGVTAHAADGTPVTGNIQTKTGSDLTTSGATVTVPAGYYASNETVSVATTTHPAPTASVNSSTGLVTASHTQGTGYVTGGTKTGTYQLTTQGATTITPTEYSQTAVPAGRYTKGAVTVDPIPSEYIIPSGNVTITSNGSGIDVGQYATATVNVVAEENKFIITMSWDDDYYGPGEGAWVPDCTFAELLSAENAGKEIAVRADPAYGSAVIADGFWEDDDWFIICVNDWSSSIGFIYDWQINEYSDGGSGSIIFPNFESPTRTYTPTESQQTEVITYDALDDFNGIDHVTVTVNAIPSNYVGSSIPQNDSSDLTVSGATVTAPAGYYAASASKAVASGTATPAASITGTAATVSTGTNTLTLTKTVSNTPQVSAGYISSGTAGNTNVSLTANVTTQAAQTIYPSSSDQTISSGKYLSGTQTIKAVTTSNLTAANIKNGITVTVGDSADADRVLSVTGTYTGGGSGPALTLISTTSLGTLTTSSTSATDTTKSLSLASSTGWSNYDLLVIDISVDTQTNGRHTSTVSMVWITHQNSYGTPSNYAVSSNRWNSKMSSSGTASTRQSGTAYGIYANSVSVSNGTMTIPLYYRYNSNYTATINGTYTARVYGVNLYDLIGG